MAIDSLHVRQAFPSLCMRIADSPLVYLDSAATTLRPQAVLDAMLRFSVEENANPHRSMHVLAERATRAYEQARTAVAAFLQAENPAEIIFTRNATESINLIARTVGEHWQSPDAIAVTTLEHHSNIVPWQQLAERRGVSLRWIPCGIDGDIDLEQVTRTLADGCVKLLAITAQSNVLGTMPDLESIIQIAHRHGALVLVDAAQWVAHHPTDVQALDCDFLVFSGHKLYGPMGIGVLYGKRALLEQLPPFLGGGSMVQTVSENRYIMADLPQKFEAGTPPVPEAVGLAAAIAWLQTYDWADIANHEHAMLTLALQELQTIPELALLGPKRAQAISGVMSYTTNGVHPHDLTDWVGRQGICLRAGHHCAAPLHTRLGITASTRLSVGIYTTAEDIRAAAQGIRLCLAQLRSRSDRP